MSWSVSASLFRNIEMLHIFLAYRYTLLAYVPNDLNSFSVLLIFVTLVKLGLLIH
jgi:hypothetical protein